MFWLKNSNLFLWQPLQLYTSSARDPGMTRHWVNCIQFCSVSEGRCGVQRTNFCEKRHWNGSFCIFSVLYFMYSCMFEVPKELWRILSCFLLWFLLLLGGFSLLNLSPVWWWSVRTVYCWSPGKLRLKLPKSSLHLLVFVCSTITYSVRGLFGILLCIA